jgi:NAD(P)-dependent dehydrogenase (short-subunit alcohol dehydrogenase family)
MFALTDLFSVSGRVALVTGGATGLGRICAEALLSADAPFATYPWKAWERVMAVNVAGLFTLTRELAPLLLAAVAVGRAHVSGASSIAAADLAVRVGGAPFVSRCSSSTGRGSTPSPRRPKIDNASVSIRSQRDRRRSAGRSRTAS